MSIKSATLPDGTTEVTSGTSHPVERHPLQPFLPVNAKVLMLGSFPPPHKRWSMEFFYPNRSNMMWEMMGYIFFGDTDRLVDKDNNTFRLDDIKTLLSQKGIAIYDTACAVKRLQDNASDKYLEVVEKTDLPALLTHIPQCHDIVCTGEKSAGVLCEDYGLSMPAVGCSCTFSLAGREMHLHRLPSTSRAYPLPLPQKAHYYEVLFHGLGLL